MSVVPRIILTSIALVSVWCTLTSRLAAQQSADSTPRVVRGSVRDAASREPLDGVSVRVNDGGVATSNENGEFTIEVRGGTHITLHARRLGYDSLSLAVELPPSRESHVDLELRRTAQTLDTVAVASRATSWSPKVEGFEHRLARHNGGTFFTREDIEQRRPLVVSDVVRRSPGVRIVDSMGVRLFASARGNKIVDGPRGKKSVPCIMRVGVDGQVMEWGFGADQISPGEVYGIEVYSGPATVPREYASQVVDNYCGLVMIWTR